MKNYPEKPMRWHKEKDKNTRNKKTKDWFSYLKAKKETRIEKLIKRSTSWF